MTTINQQQQTFWSTVKPLVFASASAQLQLEADGLRKCTAEAAMASLVLEAAVDRIDPLRCPPRHCRHFYELRFRVWSGQPHRKGEATRDEGGRFGLPD